MPIEKDETGKRWVEIAFTVPGTPEQVWQAMATGPGYAAWFTRAVIEERVGGELKFEFAPGVSTTGEVTKWEPPHSFGYVEREWDKGAPPLATEITIASRSGGQCVVRMVHSLFSSTDDWDDQMEGFEHGWSAFIEVLRLYLAHFAGMKAASFMVVHPVEASQSVVWSALLEKLTLAGANVGDRREVSQPEKLSAVVERIHQDQKSRAITLRLDAPTPGVVIVGCFGTGTNTNASASIFFYGDTAAAQTKASEPKWTQWLRDSV